jgi:tRNA threonylcarbamoyladenosine biosynthesis protein TsaE
VHRVIELATGSAAETRRVAAALAGVLRPGDVVVLSGELGSGKTTFAQGAIAALGVDEPVTSPTFAIVQEYDGVVRVAHVDLYRLDTVQEVDALGLEEIVDDGRVTFVEWGERFLQALPADHLAVHFAPGDATDVRRIHVAVHGPAWHGRAERLRRALAGAPGE